MRNFLKTVLAITMFAGLTLPVGAQDLNAVKNRMAARLAAVDALKAARTVGENSDGYLTLLKDQTGENQALVEAENADRRLVYEAIAEKTGSSATLVGRRRAEQIRGLASPGTMVQDADGKWSAKQ